MSDNDKDKNKHEHKDHLKSTREEGYATGFKHSVSPLPFNKEAIEKTAKIVTDNLPSVDENGRFVDKKGNPVSGASTTSQHRLLQKMVIEKLLTKSGLPGDP